MYNTAENKIELTKNELIELSKIFNVLINNNEAFNKQVIEELVDMFAAMNPNLNLMEIKKSLRVLDRNLRRDESGC